MMHKQNLFFIGLDDFTLQQLQQLPQAEYCAFHPLLELDAIRDLARCDIRELIHEAVDSLAGFKGTVDGIASEWGFPASALVPILAARSRLPSPPLEAVLRCEHGYWARREQAEAVPEHVPSFQAFNPLDNDLSERLTLEPPYWIRSFESFRSDLVFPVHGPEQLSAALTVIGRQEALPSEPFQWILTNFELPAEIRQMRETFLAESMIAGERCTVQGYVHEGEVHGHILSAGSRDPDPFSQCRGDEANPLMREVESRVLAIANVVLTRIGLDNALFSLEFFYNQNSDHIWLLGIKPVISKAGSERFEQLLGISPLGVMVDLALGRKPVTIQQHTKPSIATAEPRAGDPADREPETATHVEADESRWPVLAGVEVADSRILVVDDKEDNLAMLETILRDAGFVHIDLARNSEELFAQLRWGKPDLILLDIQLPEHDGFEICEQLQASLDHAEIPVIFITAMPKDAKSIVRAFASGGVDFMTRPFLPEELIARVQTQLRLERHWRQLEELTRIDPLTGLLNRRAMREQIETERRRALRTGSPYALLLGDIDHFKPINDDNGHPCGDAVLSVCATLLKQRVRRSEQVCRWGGEEFLLLLPDTDAAGAAVLANALRSAVAEGRFTCDNDRSLRVTLSFGIMVDNGERPIDACISKADAALYAAKHAGRNCCVIHADAAGH